MSRPFGAKNKHRGPMHPNSLANLRPFVKGDPRINRMGRPKTHDELRALIQDIAADPVGREEKMIRLELQIRGMMAGKNAADHIAILEHGWGKVPQKIVIEDWRTELQKNGIDPSAVFESMVKSAAQAATVSRTTGANGGGGVGGSAETGDRQGNPPVDRDSAS